MLNKKIVSFISALAMTLSLCSFASVQAADAPAADLEFKVEKNIFDQDSYDAGYQEYTITVNLKTENIGLTDNGKAAALKRYSGSRVTSLAGRILFDISKFYTDNSMMSKSLSAGSSFIALLDTEDQKGVTFNWYAGDYTEGLEGETVELFKINLYGMDAEGNVTIGADDEFESLFAWETTTRSVSYCEWSEAKAAELGISSPKVLGDNNTEAGWVGNLGIAGDEPIVPDEPKEMDIKVKDDKRFDLDVDGDKVADGYAWEVLVTNYDSTKTVSAKFTDADTGATRGAKEKTEITGLAPIAEANGGSVSFVALLRLSQARNVNMEIVVE